MKKLYKYLTILSVALVSGCTGFLEVDNFGKSTIESFFAEIDGLRSASEGLHRTILDFYDDDFLRYADLAGDLADPIRMNANESILKLCDFTTLAEDNSAYTRLIWKNGYVVVTNANNILYYGKPLLEKYPHDTDEINKIFAYAYFARALATFDLCLVYAQPYAYTADASHLGVPSVTYVPGFDDTIARDKVSKVYSQAIKDLETALGILGTDKVTDVYHISGTACQALLARIYLHMGNWDKAAEYAKAVMDKVALSPRSEYEKMFRDGDSTVGTESILRLNSYNISGSMKALCDPSVTPKVKPSDKLIAMFDDPDDIRLSMLTYVAESVETDIAGQSFSAFTKYCSYKRITDEKKRRYDPFVLRCSEMYLIHAEALCKTSSPDLATAADDIKTLIARATGKAKSAITLSYSDASGLSDIIEKERCKELNMEGHRLFDITRQKHNLVRGATTTCKVRTIEYPDYRFVLPICAMEMDANESMIQNEGYTGRKE